MDIENEIGGLPIDLHDIELFKADDIIKGKGVLSLNPIGLIELKIFPDHPKEFTIDEIFKSINQSTADAGKLLTEEAYYSFNGTAVNNDHYFCRRLLITDHQNFRVYTGEICSELVITNGTDADAFHVARVQIPYKINLPSNHSLHVERKYSDQWTTRSISRNIFEIIIEDTSIDIFSRSGTTSILIQNKDYILSEDDIHFIITTIEFLTSSIIDRYSVEYEGSGIYRRVFRYSVPQRRAITKGKPPLAISASVNQDYFTELFVKFHQFIKINDLDPLASILISVISAQNSFITTYALTITTAIENILHSYYSTGKRNFSKSDIEFALKEVNGTNLCDLIKKRLIGMINSVFEQESADDIIRDLIKQGKLKKEFHKNWKKLRNPVSHGKDPTEDFQEYIKLCESNLVFFYVLVFILIGYDGVYSDYSTYGYPYVDTY
ncbi:MAG: hypothetical protein JXQ26_07110 [Tissierellales bacterium]|nr:hypothetical protein [Candidatus Dojkabacteria bacterium]MBN2827741.1 hypothetical protein [Tissierellales bacterium]